MTIALEILSALLIAAYYLLGLYYLLMALRYLLDFLPLHLHPLRRSLYRLGEPLNRSLARLVELRWRRHDFNPLLAVLLLVLLQQTVVKCLVFLAIKARGAL